MHIHILYDFREGIWGGGNQFLQALRHQLRQIGCYAEEIKDADVIIFNSHHILKDVYRAKKEYPEKHFVHRIGSSFTLARGDKLLDKVVYHANHSIADGTIFQSEWSKGVSHSQGLHVNNFEATIMNAPLPQIFHPRKYKKEESNKIRLVTTGWAQSDKKGFDIYKYLDEHLDFNKYQFMFFGRSKESFKNIDQFPPQQSRVIASILQNSDIFITATQDDACSNSLIEALHCGLPAVARNSGGHPEIVGEAGVLFEGKEDVIEAIEKVSANLEHCESPPDKSGGLLYPSTPCYKAQIKLPSPNEVTQQYYNFCQNVCASASAKKYRTEDYIKHIMLSKMQRAGELGRQIIVLRHPS